MISSRDPFQFERNENLRSLLLPLVLFAGAVVIQIKMALHAGYFGFGDVFLPHAGFQEPLGAAFSKEMQESFLIRLMEMLLQKGVIGPKIWQALTLSVHYANVVLTYFVARRVLKAGVGVSLATAALVGMNPLGMEALVWGCCLHILLTLTWIFSGLLIYRYHDNTEYTWAAGIRGGGLAALQIAAFLTWDFGAVFFPIVALVALSSPNEASKRARKRNAILLLTSCGIVWLIGTMLILGWGEILSFPLLSWPHIVQNILAVPIEGLLPLLGPGIFPSLLGFFLSFCVYAFLIALVAFRPSNLSLLASAAIASLPWALFHEADGSDFYLVLPFIYLCIASKKSRKKCGLTEAAPCCRR